MTDARVPDGVPDHLVPEGETVVRVAHPTRVVLVPLILITVLVTAVSIGWWYSNGSPWILYLGFVLDTIAFAMIAQHVLRIATSEYILTNRRLVKQTGVFNKTSVDSWLDKVNNVEHRQTIWGRILGFGDVIVDTASETGTTVFPSISGPIEFKRAILEATQRYRESMRGGPAPAAVTTVTPAQRLREIKALLDDGLITPEEYEASRRKIVAEL